MTLAFFTQTQPCSGQFRINGPAAQQDQIQLAATRWSTALASAAVQGIPSFTWASNPANANVLVVVSVPTTGPVCGLTTVSLSGPDTTVTINMNASSTCSNSDDLVEILIHEMGHMIGFVGQSSHGLGQLGYSSHCASFLPPAGEGVNGQICQHDVEYIWAAYNQRPDPVDALKFWNRHVVTGIDAEPGPLVVRVGDSLHITGGSNLLFSRGLITSAPLGGAAVSWSRVTGHAPSRRLVGSRDCQ
jgi:hypothetical protein